MRVHTTQCWIISAVDRTLNHPRGFIYCMQMKAWTIQACCQTSCPSKPDTPDLLQARDDWKCARGWPPTTWIHQIHRDVGIPVTMLWSWQPTDRSGDRSQRWDATANCFASQMNEWLTQAISYEHECQLGSVTSSANELAATSTVNITQIRQ